MSVFLRNLSKSPKYKRRTFAAAGSTFGEMTTSIGGAAFPTVSPTASTSRKSFFDTSAAVGTTISGHALVAVFPVNEKKGRAKQCFVTVQQTLFEVHKNQKDAKNKKPAKHLVDFGDVFNVSIHNEPIQIKDDCICIMDLSTSFFVRPIDSDYDLTAWFDWILERTRECRSTKLLRPVFREEFFEAAWDVQIVRRPKFRRDNKQQLDTQNDDLAEKRVNLLGFRRLCFCGTSFLIFSIGCRPISNVEASEPFERSAFVQLPLNVVSNYGTQERFFFIRVGRCSEIGGGELWMATEHGASARSMHERISQLNVRESERRRAQGIKINLPTISSSVLKSRAHRERSQTQIQLQKTNSQLRIRCIQPQSARSTCSESAENCSSRKASSNSTSHVKNQHHHASNGSLSGGNSHQQLEPTRTLHAGRTDSISSGLHSIPEQRVMNDELNILDQDQHQQGPVQLNPSDAADREPNNGGQPMKKSSIAGLFASRFGAKMSAGTYGRPLTANLDQITAPSSPAAQTAGMTFEFNGKGRCATASLANLASSTNQSARNSLVGSVLGFRLTRNSNNCCNNASAMSASRQTTAQRIPQTSTSAAAIFSAQPSYDCAEDYMTLYDADNNVMMGGLQQQHYGYSLNAPSGSVGSRMSAVSKAESRKSSSSVAPHRQCSTGSTGYSSDTQQHGKALALIPADYVEMEAFESHVDAEPEFSLSEVHSYVPSSFEPCCSSSAATNNNSSGTHWTDSAMSDSPRAYSLGSKPDPTNSGCSVRPSSSDISRSPQLLHPSSNTKNLHKEALEANFCGRILQKEGVVDNEGNKAANVGIIGEMPADDKASEIRKRAHSTGSKALIKSSLKKFTASSITFNNRKTVGIDDELFSTDVPNSRRNTCEANKSMCSSSTCYPHSEDHVEIDFDRDESPSVGSLPSLHSRNSSIGVMSSGVRSALDSLGREKPSERLIREQIGTTPATNNENVQQIGRKRSVPEMLKGSGSTNNQPMCTETIEQNRLHPHRRLTKFGKSPPRRVPICREPSRQSTSSGISTSKSNESTITTTTAEAGGAAPTAASLGYHLQNPNTSLVEAIVERKESDECDYVLMLNTLEKEATAQRQNHWHHRGVFVFAMLSRRMASGQSENGKKKINDKNLQMTPLSLDDFPDEYHELTPQLKLPNQHVSATKSRSPSCSPQTQTRLPHRQFSHHVSHSTARSFYPADTDETTVSLRSSTRRKASSTLERSATCAGKSDGQPPEQHQHHRRRGHQLRDEWAKKRDGQKVRDEDEQQQHCDYAIISTSNARMRLGQRALFLWLLIFFSLVFLALHLDFGIDPLICFVFLWLTDFAIVCFALLRCSRGNRFNGTPIQPTLTIVSTVAKFAFEVLLFVQLKHRSQNLLLTMIPSNRPIPALIELHFFPIDRQ
uniref:IRS-type PTB domain-containing protein n=1 Tax=Globodera rostochiensis TaxID=31243 RepID=A0A914I4P2_GLORO